ncbi:putative TrmH family tRNA/rRNA methyltransferase [Candidatus Entotheonellaceae bacterium PAL068K]
MSQEKLYGVHPVLEALDGQRRCVERVLIDEQRHGAGIRRITALAGQRAIPVESVQGAQLHRLLGHRQHQGVVALVTPLGYEPFATVLGRLSTTRGGHTVVLLDEVTDVGNFAALIRSAAAFGAETLCVPRHRSVSLTPTVAKRSAGAVEHLSLVQVGNVEHALNDLKDVGFWVYGADMQDATSVGQIRWPERVVLVLGGEERGLRRLVRARCDDFVRVPMRAGVDSLNVTIAGAIILAYIWGQRLQVGT